MRKLYRGVTRLLFLFIIYLFYYYSKQFYELDDNRKDDFDTIRGLPRDSVNEIKVVLPNPPREDNIHIPAKDARDSDKKTMLNKDNNNDGDNARGDRNDINVVVKGIDQHDVGGDTNKGDQRVVQLPPFVEYSPGDGLGEHGKPVRLNLSTEEQKESDRLFKLNDFNQYLSDKISIHRRLDDNRHQGCKDMKYPSNLPMASVILCFHNEAWSVLLRSVHSILDRSPPELLREIILVDDFSIMEHLKEPLDKYMADIPKVKIVRTKQREGLIRGRLLGYDVAQGPVLVFLDSHIECFPGWLEPLLTKISENPKAVSFPAIPGISRVTFSTSNMRGGSIGYFKWDGLTFTWGSMSKEEEKRRKNVFDPIRSPTMPGGLFAIDKQWFTTLGTYDPGLDFWGGENMELSFKAWMCNGTVEEIPCSQVGHIYRESNPIKWSVPDVTSRNSMRVAEVWMDEYKEAFYAFSFPKADFGDLSDRKRLRESLHCHSFKWYLETVVQRQIPPGILASGEIRSLNYPLCVDSMASKRIPELFSCHGKGSNQMWAYTEKNTIMQGLNKVLCVYKNKLSLNNCNPSASIWNLNYANKTLEHTETGQCLEIRIPGTLWLGTCNGGKNQRWILPIKKVS